ncbi:unnamed protein product [Diatraea saccharalis]|uniref:FP protein C-terminal domain-containing protein n=1 Tax=Diatraea saccharalis TaxID=40085 RepID=A0A9N9R8Q5_9NEOP|nr:unnamed protein product [Diatraea saccharalis]
MDKSFSDSNLTLVTTPPNFIPKRIVKRKIDTGHGLEMDSFKEELKIMIEEIISNQHNELKKITPTLMDIQQTNKSIENSISFLSSQNEELKKKLEKFEMQAKKDREQIVLLEDKIEELQRNDRKNNFEIKNVPKAREENRHNLINMVLNLSKTIGCNITEGDVHDIYRVKSSKNVINTPIVVEVSSILLKNNFIKMCKSHNVKRKEKLCGKHLGFTTNEDTPIFIGEQLTAKGARLFYLARDLAKSKAYKFCWTSYGKVYIRKQENTPVILIKTEAQVNHLLQCA